MGNTVDIEVMLRAAQASREANNFFRTMEGGFRLLEAAAAGGVLHKFLSAANEIAVARAQLQRQLASSPGGDAMLRAFEDQAESLERLTGHEATQTMRLQRMGMAYGFSAEQISRLTPLLVDFSSVMGVDASHALRLFRSGIEEGNVDIPRLNIHVKSFNELVQVLEKRVGGAAAAEFKAKGGMAEMSQAVDELTKSVGLLLKQDLDGWMSKGGKGVGGVAKALGDLASDRGRNMSPGGMAGVLGELTPTIEIVLGTLLGSKAIGWATKGLPMLGRAGATTAAAAGIEGAAGGTGAAGLLDFAVGASGTGASASAIAEAAAASAPGIGAQIMAGFWPIALAAAVGWVGKKVIVGRVAGPDLDGLAPGESATLPADPKAMAIWARYNERMRVDRIRTMDTRGFSATDWVNAVDTSGNTQLTEAKKKLIEKMEEAWLAQQTDAVQTKALANEKGRLTQLLRTGKLSAADQLTTAAQLGDVSDRLTKLRQAGAAPLSTILSEAFKFAPTSANDPARMGLFASAGDAAAQRNMQLAVISHLEDIVAALGRTLHVDVGNANLL